MTERERLIELIGQSSMWNLKSQPLLLEQIADHLLANGVMLVDTEAVCLVKNREPIRTAFGMPLDELAELIRAKQDGRIIVPPCKAGDTVYETQPTRGRTQAYEITTTMWNGHYWWFTWVLKDRNGIYGNVDGFSSHQIGKSVFLAKEEAEKALERSS